MGTFSCFIILGGALIYAGSVSSQRAGKVPPPLPPGNRPLAPSPPPLIPPAPSQEFIDRLTKAQLAFIRHHQEIQRNDKANYNPYACLPKYICIVEEKDGTKRTAVVNGLHPVLRVENTNNKPYQPSTTRDDDDIAINPDKINPDKVDPETVLKYQGRLDQDTFLKEQEDLDEQAVTRQQAALQEQFSRRQSLDSDSAERDSESFEEEQSRESGENPAAAPVRRVKRPGVGEYPQKQNQSEGFMSKLKHRMSLPSMVPTMFQSQQSAPQPSTSTPAPTKSILRRMLGAPQNFFRGKRTFAFLRDDDETPTMTKLRTGIKSSEQCRILYNGCDLTYDEIMQIADGGQVLIEGEDATTAKSVSSKKKKKKRPAEDDEADQHMKEKPSTNKKKPIYKIKNKKVQTNDDEGDTDVDSDEEDEEDENFVPSLPELPMRFTWGKPQVYVNGKPETPVNLGLDSREPTTTPIPTLPTTTEPPPPIFVKKPVYKKKKNRTIIETNTIKLNSTHALQIKTPKSNIYRPAKAAVSDLNGQPASFASVFTEIAGSSGGIHDYFDKIANAVGPQPLRSGQKQYLSPRPPKPNTPPPKAKSKRPIKASWEDDDNSEEEEEDEKVKEQNESSEEDDQVSPKKKDKDSEEEASEEKEGTIGDWVEPEDDFDSPLEVKKKPKPKPEKKQKNKKKRKNKKNKKVNEELADEESVKKTEDEDEVEDDIEEDDDSDERRKRHKAAAEVQLPSHLPESVKEAIREDIRTGGKSKKKGEPPGPTEPLGDDGEGMEYGQGLPSRRPTHGGQYNRQRPAPNNGRRPPPKRGGGFFSIFRRPIVIN